METWLRFAAWFVLGAVIWAAYGRRNSKLARTGGGGTDLLVDGDGDGKGSGHDGGGHDGGSHS